MGNHDLLDVAETCAILGGIAESTLLRRVANGKIAVAQRVGKAGQIKLFERAEVMRHKAEVDASTDGRVAKAAHAP